MTQAPPSRPSAADLIARFEPALMAAAAPSGGGKLLSLALDLATAPRPGADEADAGIEVSAWLERGTRTLAFVAGEARGPDGVLVAAVQAVFSREPAALPADAARGVEATVA